MHLCPSEKTIAVPLKVQERMLKAEKAEEKKQAIKERTEYGDYTRHQCQLLKEEYVLLKTDSN